MNVQMGRCTSPNFNNGRSLTYRGINKLFCISGCESRMVSYLPDTRVMYVVEWMKGIVTGKGKWTESQVHIGINIGRWVNLASSASD